MKVHSLISSPDNLLRFAVFVAILAVFISCGDENLTELEETPPLLKIIYPQDGFSTSGVVRVRIDIVNSRYVDSTRFRIEGKSDSTVKGAKELILFDFSEQQEYPEGSKQTLIAEWWGVEGHFSDTSVFSIKRESIRKITSLDNVEPFNVAPVWSPVGGGIVLQTGRTGNMELFNVHTPYDDIEQATPHSASGIGNLTSSPAPDLTPAIWYGGKKLVFASDRDSTYDLWSSSLSSLSFERITEDSASELFPAWSPDGSLIAYERTFKGATDIWKVDPATGEASELVDLGGIEGHPAFSPDGTSIVFHAKVEGGYDLFILKLSDNSTTQISIPGSNEKNPAWSPDGERLAFSSDRSGNGDIWLYLISDGSLRQLTNNPTDDDFPSFSPNGVYLAFASDRRENWDIYVYNLSGEF